MLILSPRRRHIIRFKEMRPWARSDEVGSSNELHETVYFMCTTTYSRANNIQVTKLENVKQSCHEFSEEVRTILISDGKSLIINDYLP